MASCIAHPSALQILPATEKGKFYARRAHTETEGKKWCARLHAASF